MTKPVKSATFESISKQLRHLFLHEFPGWSPLPGAAQRMDQGAQKALHGSPWLEGFLIEPRLCKTRQKTEQKNIGM